MPGFLIYNSFTLSFASYAERAQAYNMAVGRYVIMPGHIHLFVTGGPDFVLSRWVGGLKRAMRSL